VLADDEQAVRIAGASLDVNVLAEVLVLQALEQECIFDVHTKIIQSTNKKTGTIKNMHVL